MGRLRCGQRDGETGRRETGRYFAGRDIKRVRGSQSHQRQRDRNLGGQLWSGIEPSSASAFNLQPLRQPLTFFSTTGPSAHSGFFFLWERERKVRKGKG